MVFLMNLLRKDDFWLLFFVFFILAICVISLVALGFYLGIEHCISKNLHALNINNMSLLSDDEIRQREHCEILLNELGILNLAEKSLTFFGLSKEILESIIYKTIQIKREKMIRRLVRHSYIIEQIRYEDYLLELQLDKNAQQRNNERENDKFYIGFTEPDKFKPNKDIERDIDVLSSYMYN